jgi:hypothetical protein
MTVEKCTLANADHASPHYSKHHHHHVKETSCKETRTRALHNLLAETIPETHTRKPKHKHCALGF